jgi:flavin reductase (DIM6/NTAB) family NADH-FMN oxidoreductase RutF
MPAPDYISSGPAASAVALLISATQERRNAMTLSFFSEVAHHPASVWISVRPATLTHQLIEESGTFTLALLHSDQAGLALVCGSVSGRERDKTGTLGLYRENGFWHLPDALCSIACRVSRSKPGVGDHTLMIGEIVEAFGDSRNPIRRNLLTRDLALVPASAVSA